MNGHFVFSNSMIAMPRGAIGKKSSTTDIAIAPSRAAVVIAQTKTGIQSNTAKITSTIDASSIWSFPNTQGQRTLSRLSGEDMEEEFVAPAAGAAFHGQAVFAWVLLEQ